MMQRNADDWLRARWRFGFWFPWFKKLIDWPIEHVSLARRFNKWLADGDNAPLGASEFYQLIVLVIGAVWLLSVNTPLHPILTTPPFQFLGFFVAFYFITELFVFSLHWIFVAGGKLESSRRSLAGFLMNLLELAFLFTVVFKLADCYDRPMSRLTALYSQLRSVFWLDPVVVREVPTCQIAGIYEDLVVGIILLVIIAGLVGAVTRPEKEGNGFTPVGPDYSGPYFE